MSLKKLKHIFIFAALFFAALLFSSCPSPTDSDEQSASAVPETPVSPVKPETPVKPDTPENPKTPETPSETPENSPLYLGNPSQAVKDVSSPDNYLLEHTAARYAMSYNNSLLGPNWVAWHLQSSDIGSTERSKDFFADTSLPQGFYQVKNSDFQFATYGFDRGHMCPSGDRTSSLAENKETFYMSNMVPQTAANNKKVWADFENYIRAQVQRGKEAYIVCGQYGSGGTSLKGTFDSIPTSGGKINVPAYTWKIVLFLDEGENDLSRIDESTVVKSVFVPNDEACDDGGKTYTSYFVSVDYIEEKTGCDFFSSLSEDLQEKLEK